MTSPGCAPALRDALVYVAKSHIPSRWANSVQVVHMVCAFAPHFRRVELVVPFKAQRFVAHLLGDVFRRYGESKPPNLRLRYLRSGNSGGFEEQVRAIGSSLPRGLLYTRSIAVAHWACEAGRCVVFESHDGARDEAYPRFPEFLESMQANPQGGVVCISPYLQDFYRRHGLSPAGTATFADAVSESFFRAPVPAGGDALARLTGTGHARGMRIVYLGSLQEEKGAGWLAEVARRLPAYQFVIIGGTPEEAAALVRKGRSANLFVHPAVEHRQVPGLLAGADFLIMPYRREGKWTRCMSPLKMFEYMASGRPILCADLPVLGEVLEDGVTCLMFEPESVTALGAALEAARSLGATGLAALGAAACEAARQHTWAARAAGILSWCEARSPITNPAGRVAPAAGNRG